MTIVVWVIVSKIVRQVVEVDVADLVEVDAVPIVMVHVKVPVA